MNNIFTDDVLNHLEELPYGTIIFINIDDEIEVYNNGYDFENGVISHKFFRANLWADANDSRFYQIQSASTKKGD